MIRLRSLVAIPLLTSQATVPPVQSLPRALEPVGRPLQKIVFSNAEESANIWFSLQEMTVTTSWIWTPPSLPTGVGERQAHGVPYRPTATQVLPGTTSFFVAGVGASSSPNGSTMIERWDLGPPGSKRIRNIAGDYEHIVIPGPILARSTVFLDPNGSEGGINYFLVNHGQPGTLLLQFINTLNIYRIDIATGAMSLLISGSVFPDTLRPGFTDMLELDNPDKGFVYVMIEDRLPLSGTDPFLCLLVDSSRSGVFSGVQIVTFAQYESLGYNKGTPLNSHLVWPHWL